MALKDKKCAACEDAKTEPLNKAELEMYLAEVPKWTLDGSGKAINRDFEFKDFKEAMSFIDIVADVANAEGHHPDIFISYNKVALTLSTHSIGALTENDFIVAAKIDDHARVLKHI